MFYGGKTNLKIYAPLLHCIWFNIQFGELFALQEIKWFLGNRPFRVKGDISCITWESECCHKIALIQLNRLHLCPFTHSNASVYFCGLLSIRRGSSFWDVPFPRYWPSFDDCHAICTDFETDEFPSKTSHCLTSKDRLEWCTATVNHQRVWGGGRWGNVTVAVLTNAALFFYTLQELTKSGDIWLN